MGFNSLQHLLFVQLPKMYFLRESNSNSSLKGYLGDLVLLL